MSAMWRGDDVAGCVCTSTVSDDIASCDELARAKLGESPNVMRSRTDRRWAKTTWKMSEVKDRMRCGCGLITFIQPMIYQGWNE